MTLDVRAHAPLTPSPDVGSERDPVLVSAWARAPFAASPDVVAYARGPIIIPTGGASTVEGVYSSDGVATVSGVGASTAEAVWSADGVATTSVVGAAVIAAAWSSDGVATVSGVGATIAAGVASSSGVATADAVGASTHAAVYSSDGVATVTGAGASTAASAWSSDGIATTAGVGASTAESVWSSDGVAVTTIVGASTAAAVWSSDGVATVDGVGVAVGGGVSSGVAESSGVATADAVGASLFAGAWSSDGVATAAAVGTAVVGAVASTDGTSTATAASTSIAASVASTAGLATVTGIGAGLAVGVVDARRVALVEPEARVLRVHADPRVGAVKPEARAVRVLEEPRTVVVPREYRAPAASITLLDFASGGTFTRADEGSYYTGAPSSGTFLAWAAADVRRFSDIGDGAGALFLVETLSGNGFRHSRDYGNAVWLNDAAPASNLVVTPDYAAGIDGETKAGRLQFSGATSTLYQEIATFDPAVVWVWAKATSGTQALNVAMSAGVGGAIAASGTATLGDTWQQISIDLAGHPTPPFRFSPADTKDRIGIGGVAPTLPVDVLIDLPTMVNFRFPRMPIRNGTGGDKLIPADSLTYTAGTYPTRLLTDRAEFAQFSPLWGTTGGDLLVGANRWLLTIGSSSNGIRSRQVDATTHVIDAVSGGVTVASSQPFTCARNALLGAISWDPRAGLVYVDGVAGPAGTPWSWASGTVRIGGIAGGGGSEATGRLGNLQKW